MKSLEDKVYLFLNKYISDLSSSSITVALSMGSDSMALFYILLNLKKKYNFNLSSCHLNHGIREESDFEQQEFIKLMNKLSIPYYTEKLNISLEIKNLNKSFELWARNERLSFYKRAMKNLNSNFIATAHNKDDIIETFFLNIFRGTGLFGASSIRPKRDFIIRPVIDITKDELKKYNDENNIKYYEDITNKDNKISRNYLRNIILPQINKKFKGYKSSVFNFIEQLRATIDFLDSFIPSWFYDDIWEKKIFEKLDPYIQNYLIYKKIKDICDKNNYDFSLLDISKDKVLDSIKKINFCKNGYIARFSFFDIYIAYENIYFVKNGNNDKYKVEVDLLDCFENDCCKRILINDYFIEIKKTKLTEKKDFQSILKNSFVLSRSKNIEKLFFTGWEKGDKLKFSYGEKKLKQVFIDWKIPKPFRKSILVVRNEKELVGFFIPFNFGNKSNYYLSKDYFVDFNPEIDYIIITVYKDKNNVKK